MYLRRLALTDFRSYAAADLRLEPGVSVLTGGNGAGKTNVMEAAAYLATLGSHRVATDAPLVRRGADRAVLRAEVVTGGSGTLLELEINPGRANRARLNRAPVQRPRQLLGALRTVLFAPEDLALVKGDPDQRRRFLDDLLVISAPRYAAVRSDYDRVLRQRTALLKSLRGRAAARILAIAPGGPDGGTSGEGEGEWPSAAREPGAAPRMLEVWDEQLATLGAALLAGRIGLTAALRPLVARAYRAVSGGEDGAAIGYRQAFPGGGTVFPGAGPPPGDVPPPAPPDGAVPDRVAPGSVASASMVPGSAPPGSATPGSAIPDSPAPDRARLAGLLRGALARVRAEEIDRGVCLVGPHRDDLELRIGELPARGYASQGESWSLALALRLAAYELLRAGGDDPVLLLDDVFAELDTGRRERLAALVAGAEQVLVTAAVAADVPAALDGARFAVTAGTVARA